MNEEIDQNELTGESSQTDLDIRAPIVIAQTEFTGEESTADMSYESSMMAPGEIGEQLDSNLNMDFSVLLVDQEQGQNSFAFLSLNSGISSFTRQWKTFIISSIWQSIQAQNPVDWKPDTLYTAGTQVTSNGYIFTSRNGGVSGKFAPVFLSGVQSFQDNNIEWLRTRNAVETLDHTNNLYLSIGKPSPWRLEPVEDEIRTSDLYYSNVKNDIVNLFRMQRRNFAFGLKLTRWAPNTVFTKYDGEGRSTEDSLSYVVVGDRHIFKCIDNNHGSPSQFQPNDLSTSGVINLADGYVWKYMASVSEIDLMNFATDGYIPVRPQNAEGTSQWIVQQNAREGEISSFQTPYIGNGVILTPKVKLFGRAEVSPLSEANIQTRFNNQGLEHIFIQSPGSGYPDDTWAVVYAGDDSKVLTTNNIQLTGAGALASVIMEVNNYGPSAKAFVIGDGVGAEVEVLINNQGSITGISIENAGIGYSWAKVIVIPQPPTTTPSTTPLTGWIAKAIMAPSTGHGKNIVEELPINTLLFSFRIIDRENIGYIPSTPTNPLDFRQVSLVSAVQPIAGSSKNAPVYIGPSHPDFNNQTALNKYNPKTGYMLYINNNRVISHYPDREELFKIAITF